MYKGIAVCLLLCLGGQAEEHKVRSSKNWPALREKSIAAGCPADVIDQTLDACKKYGMGVEQADQLLGPVYAAQSEHLPVECICERIEEGLAKKVAIEQITVASQIRLEHLREARTLIAPIFEEPAGKYGDGSKMLLVNVGMALESGLPDDVVKAAIVHNGHRRFGRLAHVVEVGESLHLAGLEHLQVQRIMIDFIDRNLNRHEMMRAVEVLKAGLAAGKDFESAYGALWISTP